MKIDAKRKSFLNGMKITKVEFSEYNQNDKCYVSGSTWINGWYSRDSTIIKKIKEIKYLDVNNTPFPPNGI